MLKLFLTMIGESSGILLETQKKFNEAYLKALKDEVVRMESGVQPSTQTKKETATKEEIDKKTMEEDFSGFPNPKRWKDIAYAKRDRGVWSIGVHEEVAKAFAGEKTTLQEALEKDSKVESTEKETKEDFVKPLWKEMIEDTKKNTVFKKIVGD